MCATACSTIRARVSIAGYTGVSFALFAKDLNFRAIARTRLTKVQINTTKMTPAMAVARSRVTSVGRGTSEVVVFDEPLPFPAKHVPVELDHCLPAGHPPAGISLRGNALPSSELR